MLTIDFKKIIIVCRMCIYAILILRGESGRMSMEKMPKFNIPSFVCKILTRLFEVGESAYIVGGSLRDMILGNEPHDFDVATSAEPDMVCEIFSDLRTIKTGIAHGTVTVISDGFPVEITTFRVDGDYLDMRRPESVKFTRRIEDDLSRRDFTINAMAYNEYNGLVDLFCGAEDIKKGIIRTVGDPTLRFSEDALRILRAFRFSAKLGFEIEAQTLEEASSLGYKLSYIAKERVFSELSGTVAAKDAQRTLDLMTEKGIIKYIFSEYVPSKGATALLSLVGEDIALRYAALFSDSDGASARRELTLLKAPTKLKNSVANIVDASKKSFATREDVASLRARLGEDTESALRLSVLLGNSSGDAIRLLEDKTPYRISQLAIGGKELSALGYRGKEIGDELSSLLKRVIEDPSLNEADTLFEIAKKDKNEG